MQYSITWGKEQERKAVEERCSAPYVCETAEAVGDGSIGGGGGGEEKAGSSSSSHLVDSGVSFSLWVGFSVISARSSGADFLMLRWIF